MINIEDYYKSIPGQLKNLRSSTGITQLYLANETGINQQNISRWENGMHYPTIIDCIKLAQFYKISIDELVGFYEFD